MLPLLAFSLSMRRARSLVNLAVHSYTTGWRLFLQQNLAGRELWDVVLGGLVPVPRKARSLVSLAAHNYMTGGSHFFRRT